MPQDAEHSLQLFQLSQETEAKVSEIAYFEKYDRLKATYFEYIGTSFVNKLANLKFVS